MSEPHRASYPHLLEPPQIRRHVPGNRVIMRTKGASAHAGKILRFNGNEGAV
jgi:hypothetical protein